MLQRLTCRGCNRSVQIVKMPHVETVLCPACNAEIDVSTPAASPIVLGRYQIVTLLGQGGMGQVFHAIDPHGPTDVAIKVMTEDATGNDELVERFRREMQILTGLQHPNIVRVLDHGDAGGCLFYVMELIRGESLRARLARGRVPVRETMSIIGATLEALGFIHAQGIIHRDIKPENIMIDQHGAVRVTDFGLARASIEFGTPQPALTQTNAYLGTENYMSPEQRLDPKRVSHKSDIYAVGVVLYEMLTGGMLPMGLFQPPSHYRPELDPFWDRLSFRMLDINPDLRPQNCREILDELTSFAARGGCSEAVPPTPTGQPSAAPLRAIAPAATVAAMPSDSGVRAIGAFQIEAELERAVKAAHDLCQQQRWSEAVVLWERARVLADGRPELPDIVAWVEVCRRKLSEQQADAPPARPMLCPVCCKAFRLDVTKVDVSGFACPSCQASLRLGADGRLTAQRPQERVAGGVGPGSGPGPGAGHPGPVAKPSPASRSDAASDAAASPAGPKWWSPTVFVIVMLAVVDALAPSVLDALFESAYRLGLSGVLPGTPGSTAETVRLILRLLAIGSSGWLALRAIL